MKGIGAVIVTHNSEAEIGPCLDALTGRVDRVVVVDNGSEDGTLSVLRRRPDVTLIISNDNPGFAAAVNRAIGASDSPLILLLNPDIVLETGLEALASACRQPEVGAAGGLLIGSDRRPQSGFVVRRFPTPLALALEVLGLNRIWSGNPVNRRYRCFDLDLSVSQEVDQPAGALLMVRRQAWQAVGGLDEGFYPVWFEDVDFLRRLREAGFLARYEPQAVASHAGGHSVNRMPWESRELCWYGSLVRYSVKHCQLPGRLLVLAAVVAGCSARAVGCVVRRGKLSPLAVYARVIFFACRRLPFGRSGVVSSVPALAGQQSVQQGE
jgi:GT2 family glycosyltransferase